MYRRLSFFVLPLLLAGCAQQQAQNDVDWRKYLPKDYKAPRSTVAPRVAGPVAAVPPGTLTPPEELVPPGQAGAQPGVVPARLVGLSDTQLRSQLGVPTEEREAGAARIWTWRGHDCAVEAWLYYDTARAGFYALDQQLSGKAANVESCLRGAKGA